ncbi:MAG: MqnA/MqnD/SBP family protein [Planctomycetota bacterium]
MDSTRVASVSFLNAAPLNEGLAGVQGLALDTVVPSRIGGMLERGEADIGLVSMIDVLRATEPLTLIPAGGIGCDGPTLTVRLYTAVEPSKITTLHADTDSHTSVALAQVLLNELHGVTPKVIDFDARERTPSAENADPAEAWPESVLLIGDKVVTDSPPAVRYPHQIDLGELWHEHTGLPFLYACWACRTADRESPAVRTAAVLLDRTRRRNTMRLDWLVARYAEQRGWPGDLARRYVGELLRYEVDDRARQGAELYAEKVAALGLAPAKPLDWLAPAAAASF